MRVYAASKTTIEALSVAEGFVAYAGDAIVHEVDFHFEIDTIGSRLETVK